jgi:hypothetical protein
MQSQHRTNIHTFLFRYERLVVPQLLQVIDGVNVAFLAFGNSYSGKSFAYRKQDSAQIDFKLSSPLLLFLINPNRKDLHS